MTRTTDQPDSDPATTREAAHTMTLVDRTGQQLDTWQHVGHYGPGTSDWDDDGEHHIVYRQGVLSDHIESFLAAGGGTTLVVGPGTDAPQVTYAVLPDGSRVPVVCSEVIPVRTEDGPSDGRCGHDATVDGMCEWHAEERDSWRD